VVSIASLWLPIVLSAIVVFLASAVFHMVLKWHRGDYKKLPNEAAILEAIGREKVGCGVYMFPHCDPKDAKSPEFKEKMSRGPVGILTMMEPGPFNMGKYLGLWFVYCFIVSVFVAYLTSRTVQSGTDYLAVFRIAGTVAFMGYGIGYFVDSVWKAQPWSNSIRHMIDGLVYALLTAGVFGWLWVR